MKKLTGKTFLFLLALSLVLSMLSYGCIWFFLPYTDQSQAQHRLKEKSQQLVEQLRVSKKSESEQLFLAFIRETGAYVTLLDVQGQAISPFTFQGRNPDDTRNGGKLSGDSDTAGAHVPPAENESETKELDRTIKMPFKFADGDDGEEYLFIVRYHSSRSEEITRAIFKSMPYVAFFMLVLCFASAWIFSRYTTSPIVRIHKIAGKMAQLDFSWYCPDVRDDEIGMLSRNINELSDKLHAALDELNLRNAALEDEICLEKERERRQMLFFSGVSHELKTPLAIVIGQLEGMRAGIGVYKNREKYLAKSEEILQSLNQFIKEILLVSHMDIVRQKASEQICLSALTQKLLDEYAGYAEFYSAALDGEVEEELCVSAEEEMLKKALGNVLGNAIIHSAECSSVSVKLHRVGADIVFTVMNTPAHIEEEHLPHLFEAFYRAGLTESHGSGLGLYITGMILDIYRVSYKMENTDTGVKFTAVFRN